MTKLTKDVVSKIPSSVLDPLVETLSDIGSNAKAVKEQEAMLYVNTSIVAHQTLAVRADAEYELCLRLLAMLGRHNQI